MGYTKQHLLKIQERVSPHEFGALAIEHAVFTGRLKLTGDTEKDANLAASQYDTLCEEYREFCHNGPRPIEFDIFKFDESAFATTAVLPGEAPQRRPVAHRQEAALV